MPKWQHSDDTIWYLLNHITCSVQYCRNYQLANSEKKNEFKSLVKAGKSDFAHRCTDFRDCILNKH